MMKTEVIQEIMNVIITEANLIKENGEDAGVDYIKLHLNEISAFLRSAEEELESIK